MRAKSLTSALDVAGLASITLAAFLLEVTVGFAVLGAVCLFVSSRLVKR